MSTDQKNSISPAQLKSLLSPLSHDLKNNLTNIYLYAQVLEKHAESDQQKKATQKLLSSVRKCDSHLTVIGEIIKTFYQENSYHTTELTVGELQAFLVVQFGECIALQEELDKKIVEIDKEKLARILLVVASILQKDSLRIRFSRTDAIVSIGVTGDLSETPIIGYELFEQYITSVAIGLPATVLIQKQPFDLVIILNK